MKFSKKWLQEYIVETLPKNSDIEDILNKKAFEVEEVFDIENDSVVDIKVLPNRAHDALGHIGMARELCADFGYTFKKDIRTEKSIDIYNAVVFAPQVEIDDTRACTRFMSIRIDRVQVHESPLWLKEKLEAIGQRSINNIVDVTNYVQFALNKPMHAYDARSIDGTLCARFAKSGEALTTLDDKELTLDENTLVIADDKKVLGLAGIKGGKDSGINDDTTSIILESANFSPTLIRKTSQKYGIKTDASKRFENGIANALVEEGLYMTTNIIKEMFPDAVVSLVSDVYPNKDTEYHVGISLTELNGILGSTCTGNEVEKTLKQLSFPYEVLVPKNYIEDLYPTLIGKEYKNPSSMRLDAPNAFSCSSLVSYLYKGIWMPSLSVDKYVFSQKITKEELQFGDLVFANSGEGKIRFESVEFMRGTPVESGIDHVGMYVGEGKMLHATKMQGKVVVESLDEFASVRRIVGYGRVSDALDEERYLITVPEERLDIRTREDLAEEIGRIIGYERLTPILPTLSRAGLLPKRTYYENKVREVMISHGFSEVMTYTFGNSGEVELVKGLADDKEKLRTNLSDGLLSSLSVNVHNAPLLGQKEIKIFEMGNVFTEGGERKHFAFVIDDGGKKSDYKKHGDNIVEEILKTLSIDVVIHRPITKPYCIELDFDALIDTLEEPTTYEASTFTSLPVVTYKAVSSYPFVTRDIAAWVPATTTWENIKSLCDEVRTPLVVRIDCFDTFSKEIEGVLKTSFAFRLVFQSYEKTLTDEEVNIMMESYYTLFKEKGYEIR